MKGGGRSLKQEITDHIVLKNYTVKEGDSPGHFFVSRWVRPHGDFVYIV